MDCSTVANTKYDVEETVDYPDSYTLLIEAFSQLYT